MDLNGISDAAPLRLDSDQTIRAANGHLSQTQLGGSEVNGVVRPFDQKHEYRHNPDIISITVNSVNLNNLDDSFDNSVAIVNENHSGQESSADESEVFLECPHNIDQNRSPRLSSVPSYSSSSDSEILCHFNELKISNQFRNEAEDSTVKSPDENGTSKINVLESSSSHANTKPTLVTNLFESRRDILTELRAGVATGIKPKISQSRFKPKTSTGTTSSDTECGIVVDDTPVLPQTTIPRRYCEIHHTDIIVKAAVYCGKCNSFICSECSTDNHACSPSVKHTFFGNVASALHKTHDNIPLSGDFKNAIKDIAQDAEDLSQREREWSERASETVESVSREVEGHISEGLEGIKDIFKPAIDKLKTNTAGIERTVSNDCVLQ